jgi:bisphosphoglycerate-independent phosphoglycerate mutase (AlkP superfamily)
MKIIKRCAENVCYHLFLDGRDVAPKSAEKYIDKLAKKIGYKKRKRPD